MEKGEGKRNLYERGGCNPQTPCIAHELEGKALQLMLEVVHLVSYEVVQVWAGLSRLGLH